MRTLIRSLSKNSLSNATASQSRAARMGRSLTAALTASVFALGTLSPSLAHADEENVSPSGKGIVGGALLGAELGTIVESIAGVHNPWVYVITDIVLGAGGAVGGWEVEQTSSDGRAPVFMLAGGLGLIIPAVVLTLNGTRYQASDYSSEDHAPLNGPQANPGVPGGSIVAPSSNAAPPAVAPPPVTPGGPTPAPAAQPAVPPPGGTGSPPTSGSGAPHMSLFDVNGEGLHLGLPVPEVRPMFSANELRQYGLTQQAEVRMPLVKVTF